MSTRELARFALNTDYEQLPAAAIQVAKQCILDTLGVAIAGAKETPTRILSDHAKEIGGNPVARVWGHSFKTSVIYAALINGTSARALDLDDICTGWRGHPSAVLVPSLLAAADVVPMTGREAIANFVVGHAVGLCSNRAGGYAAFDRGWDMNTANGCFATAALMGRALKLDETQMSRAFGIASCGAFALMLSHGTHSTPYQQGYGGMTGLQAAMLAKRGFTAHEAVFETHPHGLSDVLSGNAAMDGESFTAGLGSTWPIVNFDDETGVLCPKLYPACGATHTSVEAVLGLIEEHGIRAEDVLGVTTETRKYVDELLLHQHRPTKGFEGKFSMEYTIAAALLDRKISIQSYSDEMVARPAAQELLRRVTYAHMPDDAPGNLLKQTVTITLRNGTSVSRTVEFAKGHPRNPVTWDDLVEKFFTCAEPCLGAARAAQVVDSVVRLETLEDVRVFADILS